MVSIRRVGRGEINCGSTDGGDAVSKQGTDHDHDHGGDRGHGEKNPKDVIQLAALHDSSMRGEPCVVALHRDGKVAVWQIGNREPLFSTQPLHADHMVSLESSESIFLSKKTVDDETGVESLTNAAVWTWKPSAGATGGALEQTVDLFSVQERAIANGVVLEWNSCVDAGNNELALFAAGTTEIHAVRLDGSAEIRESEPIAATVCLGACPETRLLAVGGNYGVDVRDCATFSLVHFCAKGDTVMEVRLFSTRSDDRLWLCASDQRGTLSCWAFSNAPKSLDEETLSQRPNYEPNVPEPEPKEE